MCASAVQASGIDFAQIAPGTAFFYGQKGGAPSQARVYRGLENGRHVITVHRVRSGQMTAQPWRRLFYGPQGRMVEMHKLTSSSNPLRITFAPFRCHDAARGRCSHVRTAIRLKTGEVRTSQQRDFSIRGNGKTRRVMRLRGSGQREVVKQQLDDRGIAVMFHEAEDTARHLLAEVAP